ncbi:MAG: hypothetical protein ACAI44_29405 [Candidatus Sericytochromatia bacterium]
MKKTIYGKLSPLLWLFLVSSLAGCNLIPGLSGDHQKPAQLPVELAGTFSRETNSGFQVTAADTPEMLTFPLLVPLQPLTPVQVLPSGKDLEIKLVASGRAGHNEIRMPASGDFKVAFVPGSRLKVIDDDATDGIATVEVPAGTYDGYVGADVTGSCKLTVEDRFYYLKQEIIPGGTTPIAQKGQNPPLQFYQLGTRQLPMPANWNIQDMNYGILNFSNQGASQATVRWYASTKAVAMPVGMKEIGPAGGTIDLPNVAKLDIPPGALEQPTVVRISQALQAASKRIYCPNPNFPKRCFDGFRFISPIAKIEPLTQTLKVPATLMVLVEPKYKTMMTPGIMEMYGMPDLLNPNAISFAGYMAEPEDFVFRDFDQAVKIKEFSNFAKFSAWSINFRNQSSFHIQQETDDTGVKYSEHFQLKNSYQDFTNSEFAAAADTTLDYLEAVFNYYTSKGLKPRKLADSVKQKIRFSKNVVREEFQGFIQPNADLNGIVFTDCTRDCEMKIEFKDCYRGICGKSQEKAETIAHEMLHYFQQAQIIDQSQNVKPEDKWFDESTAAFLSAPLVAEKAAAFDFGPFDPQASYQIRPYGDGLDAIVQSFYTAIPYRPVTFWNHFSDTQGGAATGGDRVYAIVKHFAENRTSSQGLPLSIEAIDAKDGSSDQNLNDFFTDYAKDAFALEHVDPFAIRLNFAVQLVRNYFPIPNPNPSTSPPPTPAPTPTPIPTARSR